VLDYLAANFSDTYLSLMAQYTPCGMLDNYPEINRPITKREYEKVAGYCGGFGAEKVFLPKSFIFFKKIHSCI
jgi:putative pyruvate formate lyase activating enzyme